ncbi:MAG TPA: hypothetical protein VF600_18270 [Abditibacteriaceae bacterium]|jgi:hypothetical protein
MKFKSIRKFDVSSLVASATLLALGTGAAYAASAKVCFEAEGAASMQKPLRKVQGSANKPYSGKGYLDIPWDKNESKGIGQAVYTFNVKTPGVYTVWARTFWANGCGNSVAVSVNGGPVKILGEDGTYDKWHWVGGTAKVKLNAGANKLILKNRETGVSVDQFFLSQDADYTPTGIRKVSS